MSASRRRTALVLAGLALTTALAITGCAGPGAPSTTTTSTASSSPSATPSTTASSTPTPTSTPTPAAFDKHRLSITDPNSDWVIVNKQRPLNPRNYAPPLETLNLPGYNGQLRPEAANALRAMFAAYATQSGSHLTVVSPYRSYATQVATYNGWVSRLGKAQADRQSARPGYSEHQTGLAVDIDTAISQSFGQTPAGKWLAANSWKFGFIVRYQQGQEAITGYEYEPWHFRFVGVPLATELEKEHFPSLETFFGLPAAPNY